MICFCTLRILSRKRFLDSALDSPATIDDLTVVYQLSTLCESNNMFPNSSLLKFYTEDQSTVTNVSYK